MTRAPVLAAVLLAPVVLAGCSASGGSTAAGQGTVTTSGTPEAQTATIGMEDALRFAPSTVLARPGKVALTVVNRGQTPHNLVFSDQALGRLGTVAGAQTMVLNLTFTRAGTFAFACTFHPGMTGKVVVS